GYVEAENGKHNQSGHDDQHGFEDSLPQKDDGTTAISRAGKRLEAPPFSPKINQPESQPRHACNKQQRGKALIVHSKKQRDAEEINSNPMKTDGQNQRQRRRHNVVVDGPMTPAQPRADSSSGKTHNAPRQTVGHWNQQQENKHAPQRRMQKAPAGEEARQLGFDSVAVQLIRQSRNRVNHLRRE